MQLRGVGANALLLAAGLLIAIAGAELIARAYAALGGEAGRALETRDPLNVQIEPYGAYGYRQRPNLVHEYPNGSRATWNAMRFRGPVVARQKPAGTIRVILLGGSTTHGYQVDDHETIDAHMRALLAARHPKIRFEVVNLALDGYDSHQIAERLEADGLELSPDVVIANAGINDVRNARYANLSIPDPRTVLWADNLAQLRDQARRGRPPLQFLVAHFSYAARLPGLIRDNFRRRNELATLTAVAPDPGAVEYFDANMRRVAQLVEQAGAGLILSTPPSSLRSKYRPDDVSRQSYWVVNAATTQEYRDRLAARLSRIAAEATARGWPVEYLHIDLAPELFQDDCHLTDAGNRAVAEDFVTALDAFVSRRSPRPVAGDRPRSGSDLDAASESVLGYAR